MKSLFDIKPDWNIIMELSQENIKNLELRWFSFLEAMYKDDYYPNHVVDKGKAILINLCLKIEAQKPQTVKELYVLTHHATNQFNELEHDFYENGSEIETIARDCIGSDFAFIAESYGFIGADREELIATRDW